MNILRKAYSIVIDLFETLVIAGGIFVVIYAFLFRPYQVKGESMMPNYQDGEYILTNLIALRLGDIQKGEVIVFKAPNDGEKDYIKRVIATAGDTVMLKDGYVFVNGKMIDESSYLPSDFKTHGENFLKDGQVVTVPEGSIFVLGDNRNFSSDSRDWGFVPISEVIGKSMIVYWPPQKFHIIQKAAYH